MHSTIASTPVGALLGPSDAALLAGLLAAPPVAPSPAWAAPARLRVVPARCRPAPPWATARRVAGRPLAAAVTLLLAGGIVAASVGAAPVRAEGAAPAPAAAPRSASASAAAAPAALAPVAPAALAPVAASARDAALLASLLALPAAPARPADTALLAAMLASEPPAVAPAAPAPAVSFATVARLPAAALAAPAPAARQLPMITLAQNVIPPPPPVNRGAQAQPQPPPPPGYVQPPGYQDGVPFGGQPGAVPGRPAPSRPAPSRPAVPSRPVAPTVYVVRAGDTLASIALRYYGDARRAALIWEANYRLIGADPNRIFPGQRLTLPGLTASPARPSAPLPARGPIARDANYTIQPRDFLRWMAQRAYGNEVFWPEIFRANRNVLGPDPDLIYPGVTVYIP